MSDNMAGGWRKWALIGIVGAYMAVLILAPLGALVVGALSEGVGAIGAALGRSDVQRALGQTLIISLIVVGVHGILGTALAWVLVRHRFWGRRLLLLLIDLPFAVSPVIAGYMLIVLFGRGGVLAPLASAVGIEVAFALPGMILATVFVTFPFMVREVMPVLAAFGEEQEEAAKTLGASGWTTFRLVTFPALRWGMLYGMGLTFARALGEFGAVLVVSGGIQGRTETATLYVFRALDDRQYAGAYSVALLLGLASLVLVVFIEYLQRRQHAQRAL